MAFTVATYNILANAYLKPAWYPNTPPCLLAAEHRVPALVRHLVGLAADIVCLQEVEDETFGAIQTALASLGYVGHYTKKAQGKPDGCVLFYRQNVFAPLQLIRVDYRDGGAGLANSGHVAQLVLLQHAGRLLER